MKIAIDASGLKEGERVGTQVFLYNLIHNLSRLDKENVYDLYFKYEVSQAYFDQLTNGSRNFHYNYLKKSLSWTQASLSYTLYKNMSDILISPWHTIPAMHKPSMKIVSIIHGLEFEWFRFYPTLYTSLFSDRVVAVSEFTKNELVSRFRISETKINVLHEGIDTKDFYRRDQSEVQKISSKYQIGTDYILFVGTAVPRKNLDRQIEAFSKFVLENGSSEVSFVIAGSVPNEYKNVYNLPSRFGVGDHVKFLGRVPQEDLPALMSGAKFFTYSSKAEGFGLPVLEAMACGTPVLTSNTGALVEVAGNSAYYVNPNNTDEISDGMKSLLNDEALREKLVNKGYENVKNFSWESTANGMLDIINSL